MLRRDLLAYSVPCVVSIVVIHLFNIGAFTGTAQASQVVLLLFIGYGLAIMPFTYMLSFLWQSHTKAQIWCLLLNLLSGLVLMIVSFIMALIQSTQDTNKTLVWVYRLFPGFCLGNGLFTVATQSFGEQLAGNAGVTMTVDLYDMDLCGHDILYLFICAPVYFAVVVLMDTVLQYPAIAAKIFKDPATTDAQDEDIQDEDVAREACRVQSEHGDVVRLNGESFILRGKLQVTRSRLDVL
jgi:hypothetical protein